MKAGTAFIIVTGLGRGGAERQVVDLVKELKLRGWDSYVFYLTGPNEFEQELAESGIPVEKIGLDARPIEILRNLLRFSRRIREYSPKLVHSHMFHANMFARFTRIFFPKIKVICTAHSVFETSSALGQNEQSSHRDTLYRLTDFLCDLTTHISRKGFARYVDAGLIKSSKAAIVHNGVNLEKFRYRRRDLNSTNTDFRWITVGRLERVKNHELLLRAFAGLDDFHHLTIVGGGSQEEVLKELTSQLRIEGRVEFLGKQNSVNDLLLKSDAFVLSSNVEGLPLSLIEAHAVGLPIVATDAGGCSEVVSDGLSGIIVPRFDEKALKDGMSRMANFDVLIRSNMGLVGSEIVRERFDIELISREWSLAYEAIIENIDLQIENGRISQNNARSRLI